MLSRAPRARRSHHRRQRRRRARPRRPRRLQDHHRHRRHLAERPTGGLAWPWRAHRVKPTAHTPLVPARLEPALHRRLLRGTGGGPEELERA
eukprot:scaffold3134_cov414-Prasinococcus_capsulatus_cf.AAC.1